MDNNFKDLKSKWETKASPNYNGKMVMGSRSNRKKKRDGITEGLFEENNLNNTNIDTKENKKNNYDDDFDICDEDFEFELDCDSGIYNEIDIDLNINIEEIDYNEGVKRDRSMRVVVRREELNKMAQLLKLDNTLDYIDDITSQQNKSENESNIHDVTNTSNNGINSNNNKNIVQNGNNTSNILKSTNNPIQSSNNTKDVGNNVNNLAPNQKNTSINNNILRNDRNITKETNNPSSGNNNTNPSNTNTVKKLELNNNTNNIKNNYNNTQNSNSPTLNTKQNIITSNIYKNTNIPSNTNNNIGNNNTSNTPRGNNPLYSENQNFIKLESSNNKKSDLLNQEVKIVKTSRDNMVNNGRISNTNPNYNKIKVGKVDTEQLAQRISVWKERETSIEEDILIKWNPQGKGSALKNNIQKYFTELIRESGWSGSFEENSLPNGIPVKMNDFHFYEFHKQSCFSKVEGNDPKYPKLEHLEKYKLYYKNYFYKKKHFLFFGSKTDEKSQTFVNPILIALSTAKYDNTDFYPVLVVNKLGFHRSKISVFELQFQISKLSQENPTKKLINIVKKALLPKMLGDKNAYDNWKMKKSHNPSVLSDKIVDYESKSIFKQFKFGILNLLDDNTTEDSIYGNSEISKNFESFLKLLGDIVTMEDHKGFKGGLSEGKSLYTKSYFRASDGGYLSNLNNIMDSIEIEIMFHVCAFLSKSEGTQFLSRKRFIGNDIVVIVFRETNTPFDAEVMTSKFNTIFIVVTPCKYDPVQNQITHYNIAIIAKGGSRPFGPSIPETVSTENMRSFLLTKLINAEKATLFAREFSDKLQRTNVAILNNFYSSYFAPPQNKK
eukprot:TRINITY_DN6660_c0_g1_i1.p1 TRINITY_DN6660_c0_g1~~TRINITY_DN6660_c0_g1_i1.p1  ORF type:complete len:835 (-),score=257.30 TRINITY_DN6660_c0_g1_i1:26-2530(-)